MLIWSDMLDPNHNAHGNYYLVEGDYTGSWQYVPKDLTIVCWYYEKRKESLAFFSSHGFRTLAGAYYDGDTLDNPRGWLEVLDKTPEAVGHHVHDVAEQVRVARSLRGRCWIAKTMEHDESGVGPAKQAYAMRQWRMRIYLRTQTASGTRTHSATLSKMANRYRAGSGPTKPAIMSWPRTIFANGPLVSMSTPPPGRAGGLDDAVGHDLAGVFQLGRVALRVQSEEMVVGAWRQGERVGPEEAPGVELCDGVDDVLRRRRPPRSTARSLTERTRGVLSRPAMLSGAKPLKTSWSSWRASAIAALTGASRSSGMPDCS